MLYTLKKMGKFIGKGKPSKKRENFMRVIGDLEELERLLPVYSWLEYGYQKEKHGGCYLVYRERGASHGEVAFLDEDTVITDLFESQRKKAVFLKVGCWETGAEHVLNMREDLPLSLVNCSELFFESDDGSFRVGKGRAYVFYFESLGHKECFTIDSGYVFSWLVRQVTFCYRFRKPFSIMDKKTSLVWDYDGEA